MLENFVTIAQAEAAPQQGGSPFSFLFMIAIFGVMIFILFRSQKKEAQRRKNMIAAVKVGDKVVTAGGIHGEVASVKDDSFLLKIADNVKIEVTKSGVSSVQNKDGESENKKDNNKDAKK
jgi:preprotein translocase subunit YajC